MLVTLDGISMLVKLLHSLNARYPILVTPSGILMFVKLLHSENALSPITIQSLFIKQLSISSGFTFIRAIYGLSLFPK